MADVHPAAHPPPDVEPPLEFAWCPESRRSARRPAPPALDGRLRWRRESWFVYGERLAEFDADRDGPVLDGVLARAAATPGIHRVFRPADMPALGFPDFAATPYAGGHDIIAADIDLHLVFDPSDSSRARRPKARLYQATAICPGHPAMYPALVLSGAGIAPGKAIGHVRNVDVAPTIAALLGITLPGVEGRVLTEALATGSAPGLSVVPHADRIA
jgi:hypothetical protein